jgi:hypothetical protein
MIEMACTRGRGARVDVCRRLPILVRFMRASQQCSG